MGLIMAEAVKPPVETPEDKEYRKRRQWHSFMAALYGAVSGAAFIGVLTNLVGMAINGIKAAGEGTTTVSSLIKTAFDVDVSAGVVTAVIMGGLAVIGMTCTYLAQHQWTELNILDADRLARKQAECLGKQNSHDAPAHSCAVEHEHHHRRDGKSWEQAVRSGQPLSAHHLLQ